MDGINMEAMKKMIDTEAECDSVEAGSRPLSPLPPCYDHDYVEELKSRAILQEQTADDYWRLICELRAGLQEIYALRGEDELVAKICSPLIDKTRS